MISYLRGPIRLKTSIIYSEKDTFENMACDYFVSVLEEVSALEALAVLTDFSTTATTTYTNLWNSEESRKIYSLDFLNLKILSSMWKFN